MCGKDNETTGEQRHLQFLQAKGFREDVTGERGPTWALRGGLIQEMGKTKENIPDREKMVKAKSPPRVGQR